MPSDHLGAQKTLMTKREGTVELPKRIQGNTRREKNAKVELPKGMGTTAK